jgi:hypothetical protein
MRAEFDSNINVQPVIFQTEERDTYSLNYKDESGDLILQVFLKGNSNLPGARVAKAIADTIGEAGMSKVRVEELHDEMLDARRPVIYVKLEGMGTEYHRRLIMSSLFENLQECLSAKQA